MRKLFKEVQFKIAFKGCEDIEKSDVKGYVIIIFTVHMHGG